MNCPLRTVCGDMPVSYTHLAAVRGFVYNGGGLIGVGEPAGHQYEGHYLQLAGVLGVEQETGFTLGYDKYNWDEHPGHFILQDCTKPVDFGEGKKSIYALPGTEILVPVSYTHLDVYKRQFLPCAHFGCNYSTRLRCE